MGYMIFIYIPTGRLCYLGAIYLFLLLNNRLKYNGSARAPAAYSLKNSLKFLKVYLVKRSPENVSDFPPYVSWCGLQRESFQQDLLST